MQRKFKLKKWLFKQLIIGAYITTTLILSTLLTNVAAFTTTPTNVSCITHESKYSCNCKNVAQPMLLPNLEGEVYEVEVSNCKDLTVLANSLEELKGLHKITFRNVEKLVLNKYALSIPRYGSNVPVSVEFDKVNFELIDSHAINGNIQSLTFVGGRIEVIHPFGFTTLREHAALLKMENVLIRKIEQQAFKKFTMENMEIVNCEFESNIPSKAFYEVEILNLLRIDSTNFNQVHSRAFSFKSVSRLSITNNFFNAIDAEWMEAHIRAENVIIHSNNFGTVSPIAFSAITVHRDYVASEPLELRFQNNTIHLTTTPIRSLEFSSRFSLNIKQLKYDNEYSCQEVDMEQDPPQPMSPFFRLHSDVIYFRRDQDSSTTITDEQNQFVVLSKLIETNCSKRSYWLYWLLGAIALVLLVLIIAVAIWMQMAKKRKLRKMVIIPEPRTYKETQIVYQIENAGLLKTDL